jgi:O-acetyl-ADP-ribose deacetylase (regulator of RNase III)
MHNISIISGNIFNTRSQALVNTVNCVGAMGAGIALECRLRYPDMFKSYVKFCRAGQIEIGKLWLYKGPSVFVLNFPTKKDWRQPSQEQYLRMGLEKFLATYETKGIESIAFPLLGAQNGGLDPIRVERIMTEYLSQCAIPVEIYHHDPLVSDPTYQALRRSFSTLADDELVRLAQVPMARVSALQRGLADESIQQLGPLTKAPGLSVALVSAAMRVLAHWDTSDNRENLANLPDASAQQSLGF